MRFFVLVDFPAVFDYQSVHIYIIYIYKYVCFLERIMMMRLTRKEKVQKRHFIFRQPFTKSQSVVSMNQAIQFDTAEPC
jgi:hypothetical protein